jgi:hypothetical protein
VTAPSNPEDTEPELEILPEEDTDYPPGLTDEQKLRMEIFWAIVPLEYASSEKRKDAIWWEGFVRTGTSLEEPRNLRQVK